MNCASENELQMLADNVLSHKAHEKVLSHIKSCVHCRERFEQIQSVIVFLEREPEVQLPAGFAETVAARAVGAPVAMGGVWKTDSKQVSAGQARVKRVQKSVKDSAIAVIAIVALSILLNWLSSNSLGTVWDTLGYDLDTVDIPAVYAMLLFTLVIGVFVIDAVMYRRFNRVSVRRGDRQ